MKGWLRRLYARWMKWLSGRRLLGRLDYIGGSDTLPHPLPPDQEQAAVEAMSQGGQGGQGPADRAQPEAGGLHRPEV